MAKRDVVVIGGSAGSLEPIKEIVRSFPPDFPASVFVVIHLSTRARNFLPVILQKSTEMLVVTAAEGAPIRKGTLYVAPPDRHLIISRDHVHLSRGPKEGLQRPSINVTFRSAAAAYGNRVIGVLLSGMLDDGAAGIWEVGRQGGVTIVQDPVEAPFPSMPLNALQDAVVHHALPVSRIARELNRLVREEIPSNPPGGAPEGERSSFSGFTCPECHGPLYESGNSVEFRCRVGHVLSLKTLFEEQTSVQERKLYEAIVALEEGAELAELVAATANAEEQEDLRKEAEQLRRGSRTIRKLIEERAMPPAD